MKNVSVTNKTNLLWTLKPIIDGEYWSGADTFVVEHQQAKNYELVYRPLTMTQDNKKHNVRLPYQFYFLRPWLLFTTREIYAPWLLFTTREVCRDINAVYTHCVPFTPPAKSVKIPDSDFCSSNNYLLTDNKVPLFLARQTPDIS